MSVEARAALGHPRYARLLAAVRARLERGGSAARTLDVGELDAEERDALARLLGKRIAPDGPVRLALADLDRALRESALGVGLTEALEALSGPLRDRQAERQDTAERRRRMWDEASAHPALSGRAELATWLDGLRCGALQRAAGASGRDPAALLAEALEVVRRLPAQGIRLGVLAAEACGDAHALDRGAPLTPLVLRAALAIVAPGEARVPPGASERRQLWEAVGVACDGLSADVLVLGVRFSGASRLARNSNEAAAAGEPIRLTLRELRDSPELGLPAGEIFVCENPVVVEAAADTLGPAAAPLLCVEGMPSTAAARILEAAHRAGARIHFHVDFDSGGLRIGNLLHARFGAVPWRCAAADYLGALVTLRHAAALEVDHTIPAAWDPDLGPTLGRERRVVYEEQVLSTLLEDLKARPI